MPVKTSGPPISRTVQRTINRLEKAVTSALSIIGTSAAQWVPIDTGALINSQYRSVTINGTKLEGVIGYAQAYALPLHSPKKGGRLDGWRPVTPWDRAMRMSAQNYPTSGMSGGYNPDARQGWITLAVQENQKEIDDLIANALGGRR